MPITFPVYIVRLKVYMTVVSLTTLIFMQGHNYVCLKRDYGLTCIISDNI